jgi:hypothetical protein
LDTKAARGSWKLPPLILHPFTGDKDPDPLLEGSRAQLIQQGLLNDSTMDPEELQRLVLAGRSQEIRMLYYIGKDLQRWAEQCMDFVSRTSELADTGIKEQSFVTLLVEGTPDSTGSKLKKWGISDQRSIFSRAIGIHALFSEAPDPATLSVNFIQFYQRFADYLFICYQTMVPYTPLSPQSFQVELYASDEYAKMLAEGWETND